MSEFEHFIYDTSLLVIIMLGGGLLASVAYSWLEHLCWKYLEWKNKA